MKERSGAKARSGAVPEVIPAAVVRDLVDRNEQTIAQLHHELSEAQREAEEAELRVAMLSREAGSGPSDGDAGGSDRAAAGCGWPARRPAPDHRCQTPPWAGGCLSWPPRPAVVRRPRGPGAA